TSDSWSSQKCRRLFVQVKRGVWMLAQNAGRARGCNWALQGVSNGLCLSRAGHSSDDCTRGKQRWDRQSQRGLRDIIQAREASVIYLLLTTKPIEFDWLNPGRIIEVGDRRIVEGQMPVLANSKTDKIDRCFPQQS